MNLRTWTWTLLIAVLVAVMFKHAYYVQEKYINPPVTTNLYFEAGLSNVLPGVAASDVSMSVSVNDVICTYFNDAERSANCTAPLIDTVSCPATDGNCVMYDAVAKPTSVNNCKLTVLGLPCKLMKSCKTLTFNRQGVVNTDATALSFFLSRPVFFRAPYTGLAAVNYPNEYLYSWPTASAALNYSMVNNQLVDATNAPSDLKDLVNNAQGSLTTPVTAYYVVPDADANQSNAFGVITVTGQAVPAPEAAEVTSAIGNTWLLLSTQGSSLAVQLQDSQSGTLYYQSTLPFADNSFTGEAFSYSWTLTKTGSIFMAYGMSSHQVLMFCKALDQDLLGSSPVPANGVAAFPDLNATCASFVQGSVPESLSSLITGRYIRLVQPMVGCMNLADISVQAFPGGGNLALNANVTKSSGFYGDMFPGKNLVDGNPSTFAHSSCGDAAWMLVDLGSTMPIYSISLTNRADCCQGRANGIVVSVLDASQNPVYTANPLSDQNGSATYRDSADGAYNLFTFLPPNPQPSASQPT